MRWLAAATIAVVLAFQGWTALGPKPQPLFGPKQSDYYNLLVHGFLAGHLYLHLSPDPRLLQAADPYDPRQRLPGTMIVHDGSYYRGRYYIYFGVAPVVTLLLPWRVATGHDLPADYVVLIFTAGGFLSATALLLSLRRRYFQKSGALAMVAGIAVLGLASMTHAVLRRSGIWEEAIAAAYCYAMLFLFCLYWALESRRPSGWLAAAGLCFGLAVGSRPNMIVAAPVLLAPAAWAWWRDRRSAGDAPALGHAFKRKALPAGVALAAVLAGLLWYNAARFGNPFEFGTSYMLNSSDEARARHFSLSYVGFNSYLYYFAPPQWSRYFPFVEVIHAPRQPPDYYGIEYTYGLLVVFPFAWLALLAPLAWRRRPPEEFGRLMFFVCGVAVFHLSVAALLLCRWSAAARYMVDFAPALMLLAAIGLLGLDRAAEGRGRTAARALGGAAAAFSVFVGVLLSFQLHELLRQLRPASYGQLAHAFDTPVAWIEHLAHVRYGPREIELRFPRDRVGRVEPLVTTGWEFNSDYLFVEYLDARHLRLGFDHLSHGRIWSRPLEVDYGAPHRLWVGMGSLFPPRAHPFYDRKSPGEVEGLARRLRVALDGQSVFDVRSDFYDASPEGWHFGGDRTGIYGRKFTGRILSTHAVAYTIPSPFNSGTGAVEIDLALPPDAVGHPLPVLATGAAGRGDLLRLREVRPGWVRFGYDNWISGLVESGEVPMAEAVTHRLLLRLPSLLPAGRSPEEAALRENLLVEIDGEPVWAQRVLSYPADPEQVYFGRNGIGASSSEREFSGAIALISRVAPGDVGPIAARGPVLLRLRFPAGISGRREPLASTGVPGRADVLSIEYIDARHVRFRLDHWGGPLVESGPVAVDYAGFHNLELRLPTLDWPAPADLGEFRGELGILLDGTYVWRAPVAFYRAAPDTLALAANRVGASTCDPVFTGGIVRIARPAAGVSMQQ